MPDTRRTLSALQTLLADNSAGDISPQDVRDFLVSAHLVNAITSGTYASIPGSPIAGDIYIPTDSFYNLLRYNGSSWDHFKDGMQMVPPVVGDFTWVNQGDASTATTKGGIFFEAPANGSVNVRIMKKAAPATPYIVTAKIIPRLFDTAVLAGLAFRQSSDGKLQLFGLAFGGVTYLASQKYNSATSFNANYTTISISDVGSPLFLRIEDNGTNRICSWSTDGQNFVTVHSIGRTDFMTADEIGFTISPSSTVIAAYTLLSWKQE